MKEISDAYRHIWERKLVGQKPPDQHTIERVTWTDSLISPTNPDLGQDLIDLGTGSGAMLALGRRKGYKTFGTDIDPALVAWLQSHEYPVWQKDLNLPLYNLPDDHFAVVTSCDVIEHLWNPNQMLREAYRILRPGGTAIIGTPNCAHWRRVLSLLRGTMFRTSGDPELKDGGHLAYYAPNDLVQAMLDAGFRHKKTHLFKYDPLELDLVPSFTKLGVNRTWSDHTYLIVEATK